MLTLKDIYKKIPSIFTNKYIIVTLLFLIWIIFLDEYNLIEQNRRLNILKHKQDQIKNLQLENKEIERKLDRLKTDYEELERFARENFLMKKKGEDIIIIRDKSNE